MKSFPHSFAVVAVGLGMAMSCAPPKGPAPQAPAPSPPPAPAPVVATPPADPVPPPATAPTAPPPPATAPTAPPPPRTVQSYVRVGTPRVVLAHVRVIDGAGHPPLLDRNVIIEHGKIAQVAPGADVPADPGTTVLDLRGDSVMPGLVGMHDHLFYAVHVPTDEDGNRESPPTSTDLVFSSGRLYLASGVTTLRTTGSIEPYADLNFKQQVDAGKLIGPHIDVTGPFLDGESTYLQIHHLSGPDEARQMVNYWADRGATSFKAYTNITRAELKAAIEAAHKRGLKLTGHLCSVSYVEAAELGIDNLEHGFFVNTQLDPDKKPDLCPATGGLPTLQQMMPGGPEATALIAKLVKRHVAVTSTLPVFESNVPGRPPLRKQQLDALSPETLEAYLQARKRLEAAPGSARYSEAILKRDMALERQFVAAGGVLLAGPDPTGNGGVVAGFGDQRELELLVEAGFSPVEAIQIATLNGATYLGRQAQIGSIAQGKNADLVVVRGDPSSQISDIENVELVFKDGVGFDSAMLMKSVEHRYGRY